MTRWKFYLALEEVELTAEDHRAIHEAGCDAGTIVRHGRATYIAFDREDDSFGTAAVSAIVAIERAGYSVVRVEVDDETVRDGQRRVVWDAAQAALAKYFCHFVALSGCYHAVDSLGNPTDHAGAFHYSGFILELRGDWHWVTAAHVFEDEVSGIDTLLRKRKIVIDRCILNDSFTHGRKSKAEIPFSHLDYPPIKLYDKEQCLDICAVKLTGQHRRLLEANGVLPLTESHWRHPQLSSLDLFFMIGLPNELEETNITPEPEGYHVATKPEPVAIYIDRVEQSATPTSKPMVRFEGVVSDKAGDVVGMSGGPIFGLRDGDPQHYLIGVQSSWSKPKRHVFGCPIGVLIEHLSR